MRAVTLTGPAAALGLRDEQYAAGRDTVPSSCFAHRLVKEVHLPSGDSPGLAPRQAILCSSWQSASPPWERVMLCS